MKFSVLHVLPSLDPRWGGPVRAVAELVAGLEAAGVPAAIAAPEGERRRAGRAPLVGCGVWRVPRGPLVRLPEHLSLPAPTVVHVHGLSSFVPWSPFVKTRRHGPVVGTLHGVLDWRAKIGGGSRLRRAWQRCFDEPLLARLDGVHVTRPSEVESVRSFLAGRPDPVCIPWTIAAGRPSDEAPPRSRRPYLLGVARLHPIKGFERLFKSFARVAASADVRLLLAGAGGRAYTAALSRAAEAAGIRSRVEFLGLLGPDVLRAHYAEASAMVLPSRYENFGMVVLEAMREGCPVVASRETPWSDLEARGSGRWVDFDDPAAAAEALALALVPSWRAAASERARAHAAEYAPGRVVPRFVTWYEEVLHRASPRP